MKKGKCPKCKSETVFMKKNGITEGNKKVFVRTSFMSASSDRYTYLCSNCGYFENYIEDKAILDKVSEKWLKTAD